MCLVKLFQAEDAFKEADLDQDGQLTFEEFQKWYSRTQPSDRGAAVNMVKSAESAAARHIQEGLSMADVRRITNLESLHVSDVFERFATVTCEEGTISLASFLSVFEKIEEEGTLSKEEAGQLPVLLSTLFNVFDADGNGVVDFTELTSGLSMLCGGDRDEKAAAAFALYDYNSDGVISLEEMTRYLTAVFKVMYHAEPDMGSQMGVGPDELAAVTAEQAFAQSELDEDRNLTFDAFQKWYMQAQGGGQGIAAEAGAGARQNIFLSSRKPAFLNKKITKTCICEVL